MNYKKIADKIFVYNNLFINTENTISTLLSKKSWKGWYTFGDQSLIPVPPIKFDNYPDLSDWNSYIGTEDDILDVEKEILNIFYLTTSHYIEENKIIQDNWSMEAPHICRYFDGHGAGPEEGIGMAFHTDFPQDDIDSPGPKQKITCNMYLNDNYKGGEIVFKIFKDKDSFDRVTYKPVAGDIVIFPSTEPYYHGVNLTEDGDKYFVRSFWYETFSGSERWYKGLEKYGEEGWAKIHNELRSVAQKDGRYLRDDY